MSYTLTSHWLIECSIEQAWSAIHDLEQWHRWWRYIKQVEKLAPGDEQGIGAVWHYTWATRLPYTIAFQAKTTRVEKHQLLEATVLGEVEGRGRWTFATERNATAIHYRWEVATSKPWMRLLAPIARPVFVWNHNGVMQAGAEGLANYLQARLLKCS